MAESGDEGSSNGQIDLFCLYLSSWRKYKHMTPTITSIFSNDFPSLPCKENQWISKEEKGATEDKMVGWHH